MPDPATIESIVQTRAKELGLEAVIYRVVRSGEPVVTNAIGESMTGVPATPDMVFRNGAVAIAYVSTLLLLLAEDGIVGLDDPISAWIPDLPDADTVTPRMLITMTAGYPDYVPNPHIPISVYRIPFASGHRENSSNSDRAADRAPSNRVRTGTIRIPIW